MSAFKFSEYDMGFIENREPDWNKGGRIHNWRNHVPAKVRKVWGRLNLLGRMCVYYTADELASREEWE